MKTRRATLAQFSSFPRDARAIPLFVPSSAVHFLSLGSFVIESDLRVQSEFVRKNGSVVNREIVVAACSFVRQLVCQPFRDLE